MDLSQIINREIWSLSEENSSQFNVQEFKNLNSYAARIKYAKEHLKRIGAGSSRIVYEYSPTKVLKLAKNRKGVAQNEEELNKGKHDYYIAGSVAEVYDGDENNFSWILSERTNQITPKRFEELTGVSLGELENFLTDHNLPYNRKIMSDEKRDEMWNNEFSANIVDLMGNYDFGIGDLARISSYGEVNRNGTTDVVLIDYGLTDKVHDKFYKRTNENIEQISKLENKPKDVDVIYDKNKKPFYVKKQKDYISIFEYINNRLRQIGGISYHIKKNKLIPLNVSIEDKYKKNGIAAELVNYIKEGNYMTGMYSDDDLEYINDPNDKSDGALSGFALQPPTVSDSMGDVEEGVGDKFLSNKGIVPDEEEEFNKKYNIKKEYDVVVSINGYNIIRNPNNLKDFDCEVRGVIDTKGNLYLQDDASELHDYIIEELVNNGLINNTQGGNWWKSLPKDFISVQRYLCTNKISIGESEVLHPKAKTNVDYKGRIDNYNPETMFKIYENFIKKAKINNPKIDFINDLVDSGNISEGLGDKLISNNKMNLPIGKIFTTGGKINEIESFLNISPELLKKAVNFVEHWGESRKYNKKTTTLRKIYWINSQNINKALEMTNDGVKYYDNLMKLQSGLKKLGLIKEDLKYSHISGDATKDKYMIGEDGTSSYTTQQGSRNADDIAPWLQEEVIPYSDNDLDYDDNYDMNDIYTQIMNIVEKSGINILRNKDVSGFVMKDGVVAGAIFTEVDSDEYSFDVVVDEKYRDGGLGKELIQYGIDEYKYYKEVYGDDLKLNLDVVSPIMRNLLKKHFNFKDVEKTGVDRYNMEINEESISRLLSHIQKGDFGIISANRNELTPEENNTQTKKLSSAIQTNKAGHINLEGHWEELHQQTGTNVPVKEKSFFIPKPKDIEPLKFKDWILQLGDDFNQESVIIGVDGQVAEFFMNGGRKKLGNNLSMDRINKAYSSMRKKPNVRFVFESINESRRIFEPEHYKDISDEEIINNKILMDDFQRQKARKEYFSPQDVDDILHLYISIRNNFNRYIKLWGGGAVDIGSQLLVQTLKQHGVIKESKRLFGDKTYEEVEEAKLKEERIKSWMPKMTTPTIKKSCRLGGKKDGTSDACSQGDAGAVSYKPLVDGQSHKPNEPNVADDKKWFDKKINESIIKRKEKDEIFNYESVKIDAWSDPIKQGKEFYKVNFDLENNNTTNEKKTIFINKNLRKDQSIKYEINAELWEAGGDWEYTVMYFKVEITHDYGLILSDEEKKKIKEPEFPWDVKSEGISSKRYIMIPPVEAGNKLTKYGDLAKDKYVWAAWQDESLSDEGIDEKDIRITDDDRKNAWKWLEETLIKAVDDRHKMLDESINRIKNIIKEEILKEVGEGSSQPYGMSIQKHPNGLSAVFSTEDGTEYSIRGSYGEIDKFKSISGVGHEESDMVYVSQQLPDKLVVATITFTLKELDKPMGRIQSKIKKPNMFPTTNKGDLFRIMSTVAIFTKALYFQAKEKFGKVDAISYYAKKDNATDQRRENLYASFIKKGIEKMGLKIKRMIRDGSKMTYIVSDIINKNITQEGVGDKFLQNKGIMPDEEAEFDKQHRIEQEEELVFNESPDGWNMVKNPKKPSNIDDDVRGVIDKYGNMYLETKDKHIHTEIVDILTEKGVIGKEDMWWKKEPREFLTIQRVDKTNNIRVGESNMLFGSDIKYIQWSYNTSIQSGIDLPPIEELRAIFDVFLKRAQQKNPRWNIISKKMYENVTKEGNNSYIKSMINEGNIPTLEGLPFKDKIESIGGEIYSVGGAVRDEYLGKASKDLDIVVKGIPENELLELLQKYGRAEIDGKSFGVIKFKEKDSDPTDEPIDIALPRTEKSTGAGHKNFEVSVDHNLDIEDDLSRRDFTVNAIAKDSDGAIIDPFNGRQDLKDKILRMVSPQSFIDDELRMLRGVQFASRFGFDIEPKTLKAIRKAAPTIKNVAKERWLLELEKIVDKGDPWTGLVWLKKTNLYEHMFGKEVGHNRAEFDKINTLGEFIYMIIKDSVPKPVEFLLTNLMGGTSKEGKSTKAKLGKEIGALNLAFKNVSDIAPRNRVIASKMLSNKYYPEIANSEILPEPIKVAIDELKSGKYPLSVKELAVNGHDLMELGLKNTEIGKANDILMFGVYYDKVRNEKDALLKYLQSKPPTPEPPQLKESVESQQNFGCLMVYPEMPMWDNIISKIKESDVYQAEGYGKENEPHVTILYGFHDKVTADDFIPFLSGISEPINIQIKGISHFENDKFDVVKLDCESQILREIRQQVEGLQHTKTYPKYSPHMTLAYVKPGMGKKYNYQFKKPINIVGTKIVYNSPQKIKTEMEVAQEIAPEAELL